MFQDLVAWVTLGAHHIPHSEDIPIVTTPGVQLTFYLLPYNYFDEDPSLASRDNIRVERGPQRSYIYKYSGVPGGEQCHKTNVECRGTSKPSTDISKGATIARSQLLVSLFLAIIGGFHAVVLVT